MTNNTTFQKREDRLKLERAELTKGVHYTPRVDIVETDDELVLFADWPGVKPEDANVRYENGELVLWGRCPGRQQETDNLLCEYGVGDFYRAFTLNDIDGDKIEAELKSGVLTVHLPKTEVSKPRRIAVKGERWDGGPAPELAEVGTGVADVRPG